MKIPKSFNELTVGQYQEVSLLIDNPDPLDRAIKILACLSGNTVDFIEKHTPAQIKEWVKDTAFIYDPDSISKKIVKRIIANRRFYCPIIGAEQLNAGQLLTLKHLEEQNKPTELLHEMLACIYVDMDWRGRPKEYNAGDHKRKANDLKQARIGDVYGTLFFYANVFEKSKPIMITYLNEANKTIQETMPEVLKWAKENPQILKEAGLKVS